MSEIAQNSGATSPEVRSTGWQQRIGEHLAAVETRLDREIDSLRAATPEPIEGLDPVGYIRRLLRGGKRIRPTMVLLGWVAADVQGTGAGEDDMLQAAAAVELLHCFALIHDDVMDESGTRRGRPTVHAEAARWHERRGARGDSQRFGDSVATLVGDLAHSEADRLAAALADTMQRVWRSMVLELVDGQLRDLAGSAAAERRTEQVRHVARQKTGNYTVARPLQLGAMAAGAGPAALNALEAYGARMGEAFALRDDLLGVFGDPDETGKPAGDDIRSGKPTVLLSVAQSRLHGRAAAALDAVGTAEISDADVSLLMEAMRHEGVVDTVEQMIDDRVTDALAALRTGAGCGALSIDGVGQLSRLARTLARREH